MSLPMTASAVRAGPRPAAKLIAFARSEQSRELEPFPALKQLLLRLRLLPQAPQADETLGRVVVKLVAGFVGRQFLAVEAVVTLAADDRRLALEQLHTDEAAHEALTAVYELV